MRRTQKKIKQSKYFSFNLIKDVFAILPKSDRTKLFCVVLIQLLLNFLDLAGIAVIGVLGALAVSGISEQQTGNRVNSVLQFLQLENETLQFQIISLGVLATSLLVVRTISSIILIRRSLMFLGRRAAFITSELVSSLFSKSLLKIQKYTQQDLLFSVTSGVQNITLGVIGTSLTFASDFTLLVVLLAGLLIVDPTMALFTLAIFSSIAILLHQTLKHRAHLIGQNEKGYGVESNQKIIEFLDTYRFAVVRNSREKYIEDIANLRYKLSHVMAEKAFLPNISKYLVETTLVFGVLVLSALQFLLNDATHAVASLSIFLAAGTRIAPAILRLQQGVLQIKTSLGSSETTLRMIEQQVLDKSSLKLSPKIVEEESDFIAKVKLEGVTFKYEQSGVELLKSINCEIFPGEIIALVGPSGSGKSTLIDILLGIFPPDAGKVLISGLDPLDAFRKWPGAVAYVPQETCVIMGTIKENLALGLNELNFTEEKYWGALGKAKLEDFVRSLPEGLNTIINDQGNNLSGGQRQRLGIARALLTNPQILILDEATSALDVETEFAISEVIQSLGGNTTVLTIAHRLSSIRSSNRLIYLAHGEITEAKSFEELRKLVPNFDRQLQIMGL
jgi:ABC-type multidrug transport system fused ATPase/permease subunit